MKKVIIKSIFILACCSTLVFAQQQRIMWKKLVDKKGIMYALGQKNHTREEFSITIETKVGN